MTSRYRPHHTTRLRHRAPRRTSEPARLAHGMVQMDPDLVRPRHFMAHDPAFGFWNQPKLLRGMFSILLVSTMMTVFEVVFYFMVVQTQTETATKSVLDGLGSDGRWYVRRRARDFRSSGGLRGAVMNERAIGDSLVEPVFAGITGNPSADAAINRAIDNTVDEVTTNAVDDLSGFNSDSALFSLVPDTVLATMVDENNVMRDYIAASVAREEPLKTKNNTYCYLTMVVVLFVLSMLLLAIHRRMKAVGQQHPRVEMFGYQFPATVLTSGMTVMVLIAFQYIFYLFGLQFQFAGMAGLEELQFTANNAIRELYGLPVLSM